MINKPAMQWLQLLNVTHVHLLIDTEGLGFAIKPVEQDAKSAFRLSYGPTQVDLNVPHFWKRLGISPRSGGQRFLAKWDLAGEMFIVQTGRVSAQEA